MIGSSVYMVDLDNTCYDLIEGLQRRLMAKFGYVLKREDVRQYSLAGLTGNPVADTDIINALQDPDFFASLRPFPGAAEALARLAEDGDLVFVSGRPPDFRVVSNAALRRDFPGLPIHAVHHTRGKVRMAKQYHSRIAIDDHPGTAVKYANQHVMCYLLRTPYIGEVPRSRYLSVVSSLKEAVDEILSPIMEHRKVEAS